MREGGRAREGARGRRASVWLCASEGAQARARERGFATARKRACAIARERACAIARTRRVSEGTQKRRTRGERRAQRRIVARDAQYSRAPRSLKHGALRSLAHGGGHAVRNARRARQKRLEHGRIRRGQRRGLRVRRRRVAGSEGRLALRHGRNNAAARSARARSQAERGQEQERVSELRCCGGRNSRGGGAASISVGTAGRTSPAA